MITIRNGVFETNSSSIHTICIPKKRYVDYLPNKLTFGIEGFGWGPSLHAYPSNLNYLNVFLNFLKTDKWCPNSAERYTRYKEAVDKFLADNEIEGEFLEQPEDWTRHGYIDHESECDSIFDKIFADPEMMENFLLSPGNYIICINDNGDIYDFLSDFLPTEKNFWILRK